MDYGRTFLLNINTIACVKAQMSHPCSGIHTSIHCAESLTGLIRFTYSIFKS